MNRKYNIEYAKERESIDKLSIRIPKELHEKFKTKLNGENKSQWILNKIKEFVND